jgi:pimeloyl-ACP methyl ester carboxylesterase
MVGLHAGDEPGQLVTIGVQPDEQRPRLMIDEQPARHQFPKPIRRPVTELGHAVVLYVDLHAGVIQTRAGFRVVAPDLRGYNLSTKPTDFAAYDTDQLTADIRGLIKERGAESALLVGHDWGGTVAWATAMNHPEVVDRLAILNAAHPRKLSQGLHDPDQLRRSWYFFFALPDLPMAFRLRP